MWPWQRSTGTTRMRMALCTWPMPPRRCLAAWGQQPPRMGAALGRTGPAILSSTCPLTIAFTAQEARTVFCVCPDDLGAKPPAVISTSHDNEARPACFLFCAHPLWWLLRILEIVFPEKEVVNLCNELRRYFKCFLWWRPSWRPWRCVICLDGQESQVHLGVEILWPVDGLHGAWCSILNCLIWGWWGWRVEWLQSGSGLIYVIKEIIVISTAFTWLDCFPSHSFSLSVPLTDLCQSGDCSVSNNLNG